jgi:hypothetical protein
MIYHSLGPATADMVISNIAPGVSRRLGDAAVSWLDLGRSSSDRGEYSEPATAAVLAGNGSD